MSTLTSREWRLKLRPIGMPSHDSFELATAEIAAPGDGEVQVRNHWLSVDPYMRGRMMDRESYVPPFQIGAALEGGAVGEVIASNDPGFAPGDMVNSMAGWREAYVAKPADVMMQKLPAAGLPPQAFLGVAGMPGLTAYGGLLRIGQPKEGETVFVSGAAGAVGSIVCQIAKIKGCTVIGSAGGADKCAWLESIGVDKTIDYKAVGGGQALTDALKAAAPKGIDVYFDNVGGDHLVAALDAARVGARFPICGMISGYNATTPEPGPWNIISVIPKRIRIEGFIVTDMADMMPDFIRDMASWIGAGQLKYEETVNEGVETTLDAFLGLFKGGNTGKMLVKLV
ncbi:MAG: NADP-dependent oxidoreductase [Pseudomonadota bacterium]